VPTEALSVSHNKARNEKRIFDLTAKVSAKARAPERVIPANKTLPDSTARIGVQAISPSNIRS
jgi:hypothetical protein